MRGELDRRLGRVLVDGEPSVADSGCVVVDGKADSGACGLREHRLCSDGGRGGAYLGCLLIVGGVWSRRCALLDRLAEKRQALITRAVTKGLNADTP